MKKTAYFKKSMLIGCAAIASFFLVSMSFDHHKLHPLKPVQNHLLTPLALEQSHIEVTAHLMTGDESKRAFGHDLPSREIYPLEVSIQNNTASTYSLCPSSVDLPRIEASKIAFKISKSSIPRSIAYKAAGFLFWPLMIPSAIDGIRVWTHHKQLVRDFKAKSMKEETIPSYSTLTRVLFIKKEDYQSSFTITLIDLSDLKPSSLQVSVLSEQETE